VVACFDCDCDGDCGDCDCDCDCDCGDCDCDCDGDVAIQELDKEREEERLKQQELVNSIKMQQQQEHDGWRKMVSNPSLQVMSLLLLQV
jgi:hypothetical protein